MNKWFANTVKYTIIGLFSLIIIYLMLLACFSTTAITMGEHPLLIADSAWYNLAAASVWFLFLFLGTKVYKRHKTAHLFSHFSCKAIIQSLILLICVTALLFVLCSHKMPRADQITVCNIANEWSNGDYSSLAEGNYLHIYPNQAGIVIALYLLGEVFGNQNYIMYQLINVIALLQLIRNIVFVSGLRERSLLRDAGIALFCLLFFPCVMYTTFVYGTLIGLSLAIASFRHLLYFEINQRIKHAIISIILIFMSIMVKQNYLIFGIAIILYIIYKIIFKFNIRLLTLALIITLAIGFNSSFINFSVYQITNQHLGKGMSSLSWVSMGIKESDSLYDGWWDHNISTVDTFRECNYDRDLQKEVCIDRIIERSNLFFNNPRYAIRYFSGKNASQWNNPDFQGWWVNAVMGHDGNSILPAWLERLMTIWEYNHTIFLFLNYFQFIILFGVIMYLLFLFFGSKTNDAFILLMIVFVGGFLFHTIWEAKGQYTFVYFFLLLPISADGYIQALRATEIVCYSDKRKIIRVSAMAGALALMLLIVGVGNNPLLNSIFVRNEDTGEYFQYLSSNSFAIIPNGDYRIFPVLDTGITLAAKQNPEDDNNSILFFANSEEDDGSRVTIRMKSQYVRICFTKVNMCLDTPSAIGEEGKSIWAYKPNGTKAQLWTLKHLKDADTYCIIYDQDLALSYDQNNGSVYLSKYNGCQQQQWLIEKQN